MREGWHCCYVVREGTRIPYWQIYTDGKWAAGAKNHLLVVHDTQGSGHDNVAELTRGQKVLSPLLDTVDTNVEAGGDHTALVDAANELHNDLSAAVVVDNLELPNIS